MLPGSEGLSEDPCTARGPLDGGGDVTLAELLEELFGLGGEAREEGEKLLLLLEVEGGQTRGLSEGAGAAVEYPTGGLGLLDGLAEVAGEGGIQAEAGNTSAAAGGDVAEGLLGDLGAEAGEVLADEAEGLKAEHGGALEFGVGGSIQGGQEALHVLLATKLLDAGSLLRAEGSAGEVGAGLQLPGGDQCSAQLRTQPVRLTPQSGAEGSQGGPSLEPLATEGRGAASGTAARGDPEGAEGEVPGRLELRAGDDIEDAGSGLPLPALYAAAEAPALPGGYALLFLGRESAADSTDDAAEGGAG